MIEFCHNGKDYRIDTSANPRRVYVIYRMWNPLTGTPVGQIRGLSPHSKTTRGVLRAFDAQSNQEDSDNV